MADRHTPEPLMRVLNRTRATVLCERLETAGGMRGQSRGLLGRDRLPAGSGMLFRSPVLPLMWMHMMFMRFPVDIVFLNRANVVIRICHGLRPWRFSPMVLGARSALELPAGTAASTSLAVGDTLEMQPL
jgi:uncharacterized membrane protein (UPF0127 family)